MNRLIVGKMATGSEGAKGSKTDSVHGPKQHGTAVAKSVKKHSDETDGTPAFLQALLLSVQAAPLATQPAQPQGERHTPKEPLKRDEEGRRSLQPLGDAIEASSTKQGDRGAVVTLSLRSSRSVAAKPLVQAGGAKEEDPPLESRLLTREPAVARKSPVSAEPITPRLDGVNPKAQPVAQALQSGAVKPTVTDATSWLQDKLSASSPLIPAPLHVSDVSVKTPQGNTHAAARDFPVQASSRAPTTHKAVSDAAKPPSFQAVPQENLSANPSIPGIARDTPVASPPQGAAPPAHYTVSVADLQKQFPQMVFGNASLLQQGGSKTFHVTLIPEGLGRLNVTVSANASALQVHIHADTASAQQLLQAGAATLQGDLSKLGIHQVQIQIQSSMAGSLSNTFQQDGRGHAQSSPDRRPFSTPVTFDAEEERGFMPEVAAVSSAVDVSA